MSPAIKAAADVLRGMLDAEGVLTEWERDAVEAALEHLRPSDECVACGCTLAHVAGPGFGKACLVCQNPGCELCDVEMEAMSA